MVQVDRIDTPRRRDGRPPRRGWVIWTRDYRSGELIDLWLPVEVANRPAVGDLLVVEGGWGYGYMGRAERTLFVRRITARVGRQVPAAAARHRQRSQGPTTS